jgi:hypothetical protein
VPRRRLREWSGGVWFGCELRCDRFRGAVVSDVRYFERGTEGNEKSGVWLCTEVSKESRQRKETGRRKTGLGKACKVRRPAPQLKMTSDCVRFRTSSEQETLTFSPSQQGKLRALPAASWHAQGSPWAEPVAGLRGSRTTNRSGTAGSNLQQRLPLSQFRTHTTRCPGTWN